jgi:glycolate oxidase FAD binding subunit
VLPAGAGSWLEAAGLPRHGADLVVSTRRLDRLLSFDPDDLVATVQAGHPLARLGPALAERGEFWPVDPLGGDATVGAVLATGSSGPLAAGFGWTRDNVLGLTVACADGRVIRPGGRGGRVVKNVAGYDLVRLFTGSWGTLGVIAESHLRLAPRPQADRTIAVFADEPETLLTLARAFDMAPLGPAACEMLSPAAAGPLGVEANRWQMWARWLGSARAVGAASARARVVAASARADAEERTDAWARITTIEEKVGAPLALRWQGLPTALRDGLRLTRAFLGGQTPPAVTAPALGRLWMWVPAATWDSAPPGVWADRVARFRQEAERRGAWLVVEKAPIEVRSTVGISGEPGAAARIFSGLKQAFDPQGVLPPGRWA